MSNLERRLMWLKGIVIIILLIHKAFIYLYCVSYKDNYLKQQRNNYYTFYYTLRLARLSRHLSYPISTFIIVYFLEILIISNESFQ